MITDGGPVDSTAVLCCWKHLVEVKALCSQAAMLEVVVVAESLQQGACAPMHALLSASVSVVSISTGFP